MSSEVVTVVGAPEFGGIGSLSPYAMNDNSPFDSDKSGKSPFGHALLDDPDNIKKASSGKGKTTTCLGDVFQRIVIAIRKTGSPAERKDDCNKLNKSYRIGDGTLDRDDIDKMSDSTYVSTPGCDIDDMRAGPLLVHWTGDCWDKGGLLAADDDASNWLLAVGTMSSVIDTLSGVMDQLDEAQDLGFIIFGANSPEFRFRAHRETANFLLCNMVEHVGVLTLQLQKGRAGCAGLILKSQALLDACERIRSIIAEEDAVALAPFEAKYWKMRDQFPGDSLAKLTESLEIVHQSVSTMYVLHQLAPGA